MGEEDMNFHPQEGGSESSSSKLVLYKQLFSATELTPEMKELLPSWMLDFAGRVFDLRMKLAKRNSAGRGQTESSLGLEILEIADDPVIERYQGLKGFLVCLYGLEEISGTGKGSTILPRLVEAVEEFVEKYEIPDGSQFCLCTHLLVMGTFNNFEGVWRSYTQGVLFDVDDMLERDESNTGGMTSFRQRLRGGTNLTVLDPGTEPDEIDVYQSEERKAGVIRECKPGDVVHIAPLPESSQFRTLEPLFRNIGAPDVQIHGMVEEVIRDEDGGVISVRVVSTYFPILCDLRGVSRQYIKDEDRTFSAGDISVIIREDARKYVESGTGGRFYVGQEVYFLGIDVDGKKKIFAMKVEGYFNGFLLGTIVDQGSLENHRTAILAGRALE